MEKLSNIIFEIMDMVKLMNSFFMMVKDNLSKLRRELHNFIISYYQYCYSVGDGMIRIQKEYGGKLYVVVNDRIVNPNFNISHTGGLAF
jgi:phosphopantetheinyl transferase